MKKKSKNTLALALSVAMLAGSLPLSAQAAVQNGWETVDGRDYWYEDGVRQGYDPNNPSYRGKEIYDPGSDAWYWLDNVNEGAKAVSKDVYQESAAGPWAENADGTGKWVRYDASGHMIKGWDQKDGKKYYFDTTFGTMAKGTVTIGQGEYYFNGQTGVAETGWARIGNNDYWYEDGERQGYDPGNPDYRGKEIYDPGSNAWYWLDNVNAGAKAVSKDVYQESEAGPWAENADGTGKWVRYDAQGHMVKGWNSKDNKKYYFDPTYGTMAKGLLVIEGSEYYFNATTGALEAENGKVPEKYGWKKIGDRWYWYENGVRQGYSPDKSYKGKEICDPDTKAWYYLDNSRDGARLENVDVQLGDRLVRYGGDGKMLKGWNDRDGKRYYYDEANGNMARGIVSVYGVEYYFNETTGELIGEYKGGTVGYSWLKSGETRYNTSNVRIGAVNYSYDFNGNLTQRIEMNGANQTIYDERYEYNSVGKVTYYKYTDYLSYGNTYSIRYEYDENTAQLVQTIWYNSDESINQIVKDYVYKDGRPTEATIFEADGSIGGYIVFSYDGSTEEERWLNAEKGLVFRMVTDYYIYDGVSHIYRKRKISGKDNTLMEGERYEYDGPYVTKETKLGNKGSVIEETTYGSLNFPAASTGETTYSVESTTVGANGAVIRTATNSYTLKSINR